MDLSLVIVLSFMLVEKKFVGYSRRVCGGCYGHNYLQVTFWFSDRSVMISAYMADALFLIQSVFAFQKERRRNCKGKKGFSGGEKDCEQDFVFL